MGAEDAGGLVDQPLGGGGGRLIGGECRRPGQVADRVAPERLLVIDDEAFVVDVGGAAETVDQVGDGFGDMRHGVMVARHAARLPGSKRRLGHHQDDDHEDRDPEERPALPSPLDRGHELRRWA